MALANMGFTKRVVAGGVEILYNAAYVGRAITLDTRAFTDGVCKAGNPIAADGTVANGATAIGILLSDVYIDRPQATVVITGHINTARAEAHAGITYAAEAKTALKNVVFC